MTAVPDDEACVTQCILEARARLEKALQTSKRNADSAQVLAVSKTKPATLMRAACLVRGAYFALSCIRFTPILTKQTDST